MIRGRRSILRRDGSAATAELEGVQAGEIGRAHVPRVPVNFYPGYSIWPVTVNWRVVPSGNISS